VIADSWELFLINETNIDHQIVADKSSIDLVPAATVVNSLPSFLAGRRLLSQAAGIDRSTVYAFSYIPMNIINSQDG
jgi:hypothetical protein